MSLMVKIPIRLKIVLLIVVTLVVAILSYVYVGTSMIVSDKLSYVFDFSLTRSQSVADTVSNRIDQGTELSRSLAHWIPDGVLSSADIQALRSAYDEQASSLGVRGLAFLRPSNGKLVAVETLGSGAVELDALSQQGWGVATLQTRQLSVARVMDSSGQILLFGRATSRSGSPLAFLIRMQLDPRWFAAKSGWMLHLVDSLGGEILSGGSSLTKVDPEFEKSLAGSSFASGVREWKSGRQEYLVSYQQLEGAQLSVIGYTTRSAALSAARALARRSYLLGFSLLLLAVSIALLVARGLTARIRNVWAATLRVAEGDFSHRVSIRGARDEVTDLAASFNAMSDKIEALMAETAEKARLEKELETAQVLQKLFFPSQSFSDPQLAISGHSIPASECAGDWWNYERIGDQVVMTVGDVTGHGVSAAVITAAVHGAFASWMKDFRSNPSSISLSRLVQHLNEAVRASAHGNAMMTCVVAMIDLKSGKLRWVNASHPTPYVIRDVPGATANQRIRALIHGKCEPLGQSERPSPTEAVYELAPGDLLFLCTDGLLECEDASGARLGKRQLVDELARIGDAESGNAEKICSRFSDFFMGFLGGPARVRADDITMVFAAVPKSAAFERTAQTVQKESAA
jgi:sigma-B regulation protein RsbU (phosphoserine phosphatase)